MRIDARRVPLQTLHERVASVYDSFSPFGKMSLAVPEAGKAKGIAIARMARLYKCSIAIINSICRRKSLDMP
jgi:hypothetical protein